MKRYRDMYVSELYCMDCGAAFPLPRKRHAQREAGHVKDLWCYRCRAVVKFRENARKGSGEEAAL